MWLCDGTIVHCLLFPGTTLGGLSVVRRQV